MKRVGYTGEFKAKAVKQVTERGHGLVEAADLLGVSDKTCICGSGNLEIAKVREPVRLHH